MSNNQNRKTMEFSLLQIQQDLTNNQQEGLQWIKRDLQIQLSLLDPENPSHVSLASQMSRLQSQINLLSQILGEL